MKLIDLLLRSADALERHRVDFILIGGMAVSTWVQPRLTQDCDLVVRIAKGDQARLEAALIEAGARVTQLDMRLLFERRWRRVPIEGRKLDVRVESGAHDRAAFENSSAAIFHGRTIHIASPEDLVLYKLQSWRPIDRADVQMLLALEDLRRPYVISWLDPIARETGHPMRERWQQALAMGPPSGDPAEATE